MPNIVPILLVYGVLLIVFLALRLWIAIALALVGLLGLVLFRDPEVAGKVIASRATNSLMSFTLTAIPLFILMAELISRAGGGKLLYEGIGPIAERFLPGGLIQGNIVACAMFAAVSGSLLASTAAIGSVALPHLRERGYNIAFAAASIAAAGPLAVIIPPSLGFIIFGSITGVSIGRLFIAGIIPGLLLAGLMMLSGAIKVRLQPELVPKRIKERLGLASYVALAWKAAPIVILAVLIIYSIYRGITTPTEAASVGVVVAIAIGLAFRQLNWRVFVESLEATVRITGTILFIYVGASIFSISLASVGLTIFMREALLALPTGPMGTAIILLVIYIILGMFIDGMSMLLILTPITYPVLIEFGFDPLQAGVCLVIFCEIGSLTPPIGLSLFVAQSVSGEDPMSIARAIVPFLIATIVGVVFIIFFPILSTFLPSFMS